MLVANEWDRYGETRKPLRVTEPQGHQRSTYFISVPLKYGLPIIVAFGALHYTISQSVFVVYLTRFFSNGMEDIADRSATSGYSCVAIMTCEQHSIPSHSRCIMTDASSNCAWLRTSPRFVSYRPSWTISLWYPFSFNMQRRYQCCLPSAISRCTGSHVSSTMGCNVGESSNTLRPLCFHYSQGCHRRHEQTCAWSIVRLSHQHCQSRLPVQNVYLAPVRAWSLAAWRALGSFSVWVCLTPNRSMDWLDPIEAVVEKVLAHHFDGTKFKRSGCLSAHKICLVFSRQQPFRWLTPQSKTTYTLAWSSEVRAICISFFIVYYLLEKDVL